uniref:Uncharacterized protein n=1 Tax=Magallana gigas TaxID=29159 RepID=A0A8W8M327_MAGGI|nr:proline-rich proteoglycan 2 [Crassostrea gigas]
MHTTETCWTRSGFEYCSENEVCCSSGFYEYCCWDGTVDSGVDFGVIAAIVLSLMFVTFITLLVIKCVCCKSRGQPGRVTGRVPRVFSNRTHPTVHPTVHVNPKYNTVPPAAAVRERVPGGQVFVCPPTKSPQTDQRWPGAPPPYPGSQPTYGTHNTGATNQGHTQPHPPYPLPNHPTPPYGPHGPAQNSAPPLGFDQMVPAPHREMAPPPGGAHGNVPPPFDYIPPKCDLYR